jgi:histidyl-tRNA synthetase
MFTRDLQTDSFMQYNQVGAEIIGSENIISDVETILLAKSFFKFLDVAGITLEINSNGCPQCHKHYLKALYDFIKFNKDDICFDCHQSIKKYPLCIFKCHSTQCQNMRNMAPKTLDYLCPDCFNHFKELKKMLTNLGTSFVINQNLAMDFDYYNRLVFQFTIKTEQGERIVLASGGRYDSLASYVTKKPLHAVGSSCIIDNYIEIVKEKQKLPPKKYPFSVGICSVSGGMDLLIMQVAQETLSHDINTVILEHTVPYDTLDETIKKHRCNIFLVFKEELIRAGKVMITYLDQHHDKPFQDNIPLADIMENILRIKKHYRLEA